MTQADGLGPSDNSSPENVGPSMAAWVNALPLFVGQSQSSLCEGEVQSTASASTDSPPRGAVGDNT